MKNTVLLTLFTVLFFVSSCNEEVPQNRPSFASSSSEVGTETETKELPIPERPSDAIKIEAPTCACQNGKALNIGSCDNICANKPVNQNQILYLNTSLTPEITLSSFGDVSGWCYQEIINPNTGQPVSTSPSCALGYKLRGSTSESYIPFVFGAGKSEFGIDISALDFDKTYILTIVEQTSGARSESVQIQKKSESIGGLAGPLGLNFVSQYSCIFKEGNFNQSDGSLILTNTNTFHFYFTASSRPEPLSASSMTSVFCHDTVTYGVTTPINNPLLNETNGAFTVWQKEDPRFYDHVGVRGDGRMDIHELIEEKVRDQGVTLDSDLNLFFPLSWPNGLDDGDSAPGDTSEQNAVTTTQNVLGYYMTPWVDDTTYRSYCPTKAHFSSESPVFRAMGEYLAEGTEALYAGKRENACDFLLVKESIMKQIWFYVENGQNIQPNDETIKGKQVKFYWPADLNSPYIKKSHQKVYNLKAANEISCGSSTSPSVSDSTQNSGGASANFPTHDKRIGCIPR